MSKSSSTNIGESTLNPAPPSKPPVAPKPKNLSAEAIKRVGIAINKRRLAETNNALAEVKNKAAGGISESNDSIPNNLSRSSKANLGHQTAQNKDGLINTARDQKGASALASKPVPAPRSNVKVPTPKLVISEELPHMKKILDARGAAKSLYSIPVKTPHAPVVALGQTEENYQKVKPASESALLTVSKTQDQTPSPLNLTDQKSINEDLNFSNYSKAEDPEKLDKQANRFTSLLAGLQNIFKRIRKMLNGISNSKGNYNSKNIVANNHSPTSSFSKSSNEAFNTENVKNESANKEDFELEGSRILKNGKLLYLSTSEYIQGLKSKQELKSEQVDGSESSKISEELKQEESKELGENNQKLAESELRLNAKTRQKDQDMQSKSLSSIEMPIDESSELVKSQEKTSMINRHILFNGYKPVYQRHDDVIKEFTNNLQTLKK